MIAELIEDDDLSNLKLFNLTIKEIEELRFDFNMNFLQLVCHEDAKDILKWLTEKLVDHQKLKIMMAKYRDSHLGS